MDASRHYEVLNYVGVKKGVYFWPHCASWVKFEVLRITKKQKKKQKTGSQPQPLHPEGLCDLKPFMVIIVIVMIMCGFVIKTRNLPGYSCHARVNERFTGGGGRNRFCLNIQTSGVKHLLLYLEFKAFKLFWGGVGCLCWTPGTVELLLDAVSACLAYLFMCWSSSRNIIEVLESSEVGDCLCFHLACPHQIQVPIQGLKHKKLLSWVIIVFPFLLDAPVTFANIKAACTGLPSDTLS